MILSLNLKVVVFFFLNRMMFLHMNQEINFPTKRNSLSDLIKLNKNEMQQLMNKFEELKFVEHM